jgi:hypothetical protein
MKIFMFQLKAVAQKVSRGLLLTRQPKNSSGETALLILAPGMSEINPYLANVENAVSS